MRCPNCNTRLKGNEFFCPNCGYKIEELVEDPQEEAQGKSKTPIIIAGAILAAVLVGSSMGTIGFKLLSDKDKKPEETQEEVVAEKKESEEQEDSKEEKKSIKEKEDTENENEELESVPISLVIISKPENINRYYKLGVYDAGATSVIDQEGHDNSASMVLDGKDETSWQEGVDGAGVDEKLFFGLSKESKVKYIAFKLGNWRTNSYYMQNNRPKTLEIQTDNCTERITFPDGKTEYWVEFSEACPTSELNLGIKDVYRGTSTDWNDTCIAEVTMYGTTD